MANKPITVLLVDDHPVVRAGYRRLLDSTMDISVLAEADSGKACCALYSKLKPDVLVLDLSMPGIDGLEVIRRIKANDLGAHILVFSMHSTEVIIRRALKMGATGYLTKLGSPEQMVRAIHQVNRGQLYIDTELASNIAAGIILNNISEDPLAILSKREFQLFKMIAEGRSLSQIASIISISPKTVGVHHTNIMKKLKLENTAQLVRLAVLCNLI